MSTMCRATVFFFFQAEDGIRDLTVTGVQTCALPISLAALLALLALARGLTALARRLPRARGLAWRHGLAALQRPGGHAPRVVVALGVAAMLLVTVALLEGVLGRQIDYEDRNTTRLNSSHS